MPIATFGVSMVVGDAGTMFVVALNRLQAFPLRNLSELFRHAT